MTDYNRESSIRNEGKVKVRFISQKEAMSLISKSYCYVVNEYGLIDKEGTVDLVTAQYEYLLGTGPSNIPKDVLDIYSVKLNDADNTPLNCTGRDRMPAIRKFKRQRLPGLPDEYTVSLTGPSMKLTIDSIPDKSYSGDPTYRLLIYYHQRAIRYTGIASSLVNSSFSDLNFTTADTWGGSFKTDTVWDDLIIMGAVAMGMGSAGFDILKNWYEMAEKISGKKPKYFNTKPRYRLGV